MNSTRDIGLVRAELIDALQEYAAIFREKANLEVERAEAVEQVAQSMAAGMPYEEADISTATLTDWMLRYRILEMKHNEYRMKCDRLVLEIKPL